MQLRVCSLFAGAGGIDIAFHQAGFTTVWANEFDRDACKTFRRNFPDIPLVEKDIRKVDAKAIPNFDVLVGGFPCQPFSVVGRQEGFNDDRGNLFFEICRIIDAKHPRAIFLENVANLVQHDNGNTFNVIIGELTKRNYMVKHTVVDACNYGMAQHRTRTYIVCFNNVEDYNSFRFPEPTGLNLRITDIIDRDVHADLKLYFCPGTPKYKELDAAISDVNQLYRFTDYGVVQKSRDGISFTLKANMGTWYDREPIIKDNYGIRKLAPIECFKLQGFPDTFLLDEIPIKSAYKQAGNSVCVPVILEIANNMLKAMTHINNISDTLIGPLKNKKQLDVCLQSKFYHLPSEKIPGPISSIQYIALFQSERIFGRDAGIQYIGVVSNIQFVPRCAIPELPKNSTEIYCRINVSRWYKLSNVYRPLQSNLFYECNHHIFQEEETWQIV